MNNLLFLPVLIPMLAATVCLFMRNSLQAQRVVSGIATVAQVAVAFYIATVVYGEGVQVLRYGMWPGAFGIVFAVDLMGAIMLCLAATTQLASWWFVVAGALPERQENFYLHPLFLLLGLGVNWAFSTGDIFNLFVSFEIILLCSYVLLVHGNERPQLREGVKFVVLNILASTLFLVSAGAAYGAFGSLNMAELAVRIAQAGHPPAALVLGTMFLLVFGIKAALFPVFVWLPDAYPKAPAGIVAYFAGILTKVGVYALYRIFTLIFNDPAAFATWFQPIILAVGGLTMIVGVLCAFSQWTMRRILSFHIISQIGYMIFALGLCSVEALACGIFYIIHHIIVKASLFLVADAVKVNEGSEALEDVAGAAAVYPGLAVLFLFAAFSLAGLPPLSGFYGKYGLVVEGLTMGHWFYVVVSLLTSLFTIASMVKIWRYVFWRERAEDAPKAARNTGVILATGGLVAVSIAVAVLSGPVKNISTVAAVQLKDPARYIDAVMGERGVEAYETAQAAITAAEEDAR